MESEQDELLDAFFAAIVAGDVDTIREMYDPDVAVWHNVTDKAVGLEASLWILRAFTERVAETRYEILERRHWPGGAVQRHIVHGRVGDEPFYAPVCLTFGFTDGRISRIDEYVDSAAIAVMMR